VILVAEPIIKIPNKLPELPKINLRDIFNPPDDINDLNSRLDTVAFGANHISFLDAMLADLSDSGMGFIPIFGDLFQTPRVANALMGGTGGLKYDKQVINMDDVAKIPLKGPKVALQGLDMVIGIIPGIGDIADIFTVPNMASFVGDKAVEQKDGLMEYIGEFPLPNEEMFKRVIANLNNPQGAIQDIQRQLKELPNSLSNDLKEKISRYPREFSQDMQRQIQEYMPAGVSVPGKGMTIKPYTEKMYDISDELDK